jgi:hypothetical protein
MAPPDDHPVPAHDDTNFILRRWDTAANGKRQLITTGYLKASHRELDDRTIKGDPYHPHTRAVPVKPGPIEEYVLRLYHPTCWTQARVLTSDVTGAARPPVSDREAVPTIPLAREERRCPGTSGRSQPVRPSVVVSHSKEVETHVQRN